MASLANNVPSAILALLFNGTPWSNIAQNAVVSPATQLFVSLHNADPGPAGSQSTFETAYTGYARLAVNRVAGQWNVSGQNPAQVSNVNQLLFPVCGAAGDTLTYFGIGLAASGPGTLIVSGPVGPGAVYGFAATAAAPGVLTVPGAALTLNEQVALYGLPPSFQLPGGVTEGQLYYVGTLVGNQVTLSTTLNNSSPLTFSSPGTGVLVPCAPLVAASGIAPAFPPNTLTVYLD